MEDLLGKLTLEKVAKSQSKRVLPIGEDRHFRRYYWFHGNSADDGIWIQDLGVTSYEKYIRECVKDGKPFEENEVHVETLNNVSEETSLIASSFVHPEDVTELECSQPDCGWPAFGIERYTETWYRLSDESSLHELINSLNKSGIREGKLLLFLLKNKDAIISSINRGMNRQSKSPDSDGEDEDLCLESITPLCRSIVQLASDLSDSYLTSIGGIDAFEATMLTCKSLDEIKAKLRELADSITPSAIIRRQDLKVALQTGQHSCMIMEKWKKQLAESRNASAVHLLRGYLDSRIDWKKSVVEKRCTYCGSRRSADAKIACANCNVVVHYYCTRPRLNEKPTTWLCLVCGRAEAEKCKADAAASQCKTVSNNRKHESDGENSADDGSTQDDSDYEKSDDEDDDFFSNKNLRRSDRKRVMEDYFEENVEERGNRLKRTKSNSVTEKCTDIMNRIKAYNRLYRTLQNIPVGRASRRNAPSSINDVEMAIPHYSSLASFAADLNNFFRRARLYLEEHNERKLEELETLIFEMDLCSLTKSR